MYFNEAVNTSDNKPGISLFHTTWFTLGLLTQTLIVHMIRTPKVPFIQSRPSLPLLVMTFLICGVCLALPYIPKISDWLGLVYLSGRIYGFIFGMILTYCVVAQLAKMTYILIFKVWY